MTAEPARDRDDQPSGNRRDGKKITMTDESLDDDASRIVWTTAEVEDLLREYEDYRATAKAELVQMRAEVARQRSADTLAAEQVAGLRADLDRWTSGRRVKGLRAVESVADGMHYAAELVRAQGTEGGEAHDDLLVAAGMRLKALDEAGRHLLAEAVVLRADLAQAQAGEACPAEIVAKADLAEARAQNARVAAVVEVAAAFAEVESQRSPALENCSVWLEEQKARRAALLAAVARTQR